MKPQGPRPGRPGVGWRRHLLLAGVVALFLLPAVPVPAPDAVRVVLLAPAAVLAAVAGRSFLRRNAGARAQLGRYAEHGAELVAAPGFDLAARVAAEGELAEAAGVAQQRRLFGATVALAELTWKYQAPVLLFRERSVGGVAAAHGWQFTPVDYRLAASAEGVARNVVHGERDGVPFVVHDLVRARPVEEDESTRVIGVSIRAGTVASVPAPVAVRLAVVRSGLFTSVSWSHIGPRVRVGQPVLPDAFRVYCGDPVLARAVLTPEVARALAGAGAVDVVVDQGEVRVLHAAGFVEAQDLPALVDLAVEVVRAIGGSGARRAPGGAA
jgi:hypothetical protein